MPKASSESSLEPRGLCSVAAPSHRVLLGALGAALFVALLMGLDGCSEGALPIRSLVPALGASAALVFFAPESALSRPWNITGGHLVSALCACGVAALLPSAPSYVVAACALPTAGLMMGAAGCLHPAGGATVWLIATARPKPGFAAAMYPALLGAILLVGVRWSLDFGLVHIWKRWPGFARGSRER